MEIPVDLIWTVASSVFTGVVAFFVARRNTEDNHFKAIIDANSSFREEVRVDLKDCKTEVDALRAEVKASRIQIEKYEEQINEYQITIAVLEAKIIFLETKLAESGLKFN